MKSDIKKRFIAGAVCPKCSEMDKIVTYQKDNKDYRECVSCGFSDVMHFQRQVREVETRVNKSEQDKHSEVQILDFPPREKKTD